MTDSKNRLTDPTEVIPSALGDGPEKYGRYQVRGFLGRGGFGMVLKGFDTDLQRSVAIKVPLEEHRKNFDAARYQVEAQNLAKLHHPGIVAVYDVGFEGDCFYIVTERLSGVTLHEWLLQHEPTWKESAEIIAKSADALSHAHQRRVIHRDIKPGNVFMTPDRGPVLVDFGLAIAEQNAGDDIGAVRGTLRYMAPEQVEGRGHRIDGRTDIYALGVLLYQMLTGRAPYTATDKYELRRQIVNDVPQPPRQIRPDIPVSIERICMRALSKSLSKRYTTASDMVDDLRKAISQAGAGGSQEDPVDIDANAQEMMDPADVAPNRRTPLAGKRLVTALHLNISIRPTDDQPADVDPEDQIEIVDSIQTYCQKCVESFGGVLLPSSGQEMTACFGYPLSYEDAPRRAVHAASQIQSHVAEIESDIQSRLNLQIQVWQSIHSGMVVASGADGRRLVGDVLSLVARMDRDIEPGQITITQDSFRLVEHSFVCEELAATCGLPGQAPQTLYRVIEKVRDTEEFSSNESVEYTPLVGRDQEVSMLMNRWELTGEGFGQLVALIGDAGMGKSRLVHVLTQHVSQTSPSVSPPIIEWSCSPYQSSTAFHPAIGALQRRLQFTRQQSDDQKRNALKTLLDSLGFDLAVAMPIFCDLLSLPVGSEYPPLNLSSPKQKELTLELLHQWICAEAQQRPTLFIVEDLHWVDPSTLDFLQTIANNPISAPYLCLLTFRPDFSTPWTSRAHQTQIALNRLTRSQVSQLIASKVDNDAIPLGLIDRIADRTDGVPLFVEEYAKMLNDSADLMSDTAELSHDSTMGSQSSSIPIPATLQGLLTARLDRIGGDENVVRMAAALGREFSFSMIAAAMDLGASVLANELEKLVESQLLFRRGTPPDSQYTFKHALIQDAAYDSMLRGQRKEIHQKIAAAMETEFPEIRVDQPELLAHHYSEAGDHFNAAPLWETAGSMSTQRGAFVEAIQHLNKGMASLKSLSESPERDELEYRINVPLGIATLSLKGYAAHELGTIYQRRMELCQKLGDKMGQLHAHWAMGSWRIVRDEVETCLDIASQIMPMAREMDDDGALMEALFIQAIAQFYHGDFSDSLASCQQGWDLFDAERCLFHTSRTGQHAGVAHLSYMALNHWYLGQPASALQRMRQAVQLAESLNHPFSVAFALHHDGWLNAAMQLGTDAVQSAVRHMQVAREQAFFFWETTGLLHHAGGLICLDDSAQARDELLQGLAQYDATGAQLALPRYYGYQADALTRRGDFDAASESLELAKAAVDKCDERFHEPEVWRLCAQWASAQGNQDQAAEFAAKSLDVANHLGSLAWRLTALVDLCQYTPPGSGRDRFVQQVSIAVAEFEPCEVDIPIVSRARSLCPPSSI